MSKKLKSSRREEADLVRNETLKSRDEKREMVIYSSLFFDTRQRWNWFWRSFLLLADEPLIRG